MEINKMANKKCATISQANTEYFEYVQTHILCVQEAFKRFFNEIYECVSKRDNERYDYNSFSSRLYRMLEVHDRSKFTEAEFEPYRRYFYPSDEDKISAKQVDIDFDNAWKHHYLNNQHHPEYWVSKIKGIPFINRMSNFAFAEMLCDWIGLSIHFQSKVSDWWFNGDGRKDKLKYLQMDDIKIIDEFIRQNEDKFDFTPKDNLT